MRHPTRAITRDLRTRRAKRPGRGDDEVSTLGWGLKRRSGFGMS
jgi:hypothetical protein